MQLKIIRTIQDRKVNPASIESLDQLAERVLEIEGGFNLQVQQLGLSHRIPDLVF